MGEPTNDLPWCFWQADVDQAAAPPGRRSSPRSGPTCSPSTTTTAATATPTTSRSTASGSAPRSWPARRTSCRRRSTATAHRTGAWSERERAAGAIDLPTPNPGFGKPERSHHPRRRRLADFAGEAQGDGGPPQPDRRRTTSSSPCPRRSSPLAMGIEWYIVDPAQPATPAVFGELFDRCADDARPTRRRLTRPEVPCSRRDLDAHRARPADRVRCRERSAGSRTS